MLFNLINIPFAQRSNETSISNGIDSLQWCYVMHRPWIWFSLNYHKDYSNDDDDDDEDDDDDDYAVQWGASLHLIDK